MAQDKQLDKKNDRKVTDHISRRRFMLASGAAALTATLKGHENTERAAPDHTEKPVITIAENASPPDRFDAANIELKLAIQSCANDLHELANAYGIKDLLKLSKGVNINVLPAHHGKPSNCQLTLTAQPGKKHNLQGVARLLDACTRLDALYEERNQASPELPPDQQDYQQVIEKIAEQYNAKGNMLELSDDGKHFAYHLLKTIVGNMAYYEMSQQVADDKLSHQADLSMSGPFGMGSFKVPFHVNSLNPAIHANRVLIATTQQQR
jgi:hypothetical protein